MGHHRTLRETLPETFVHMTDFILITESILAIHGYLTHFIVLAYQFNTTGRIVKATSHDDATLRAGDHRLDGRIHGERGREDGQRTSRELHRHDTLLVN